MHTQTLSSVYRALLSVHRALSRAYRALLSVYRALLSVHRSFVRVYRALLSLHRALRRGIERVGGRVMGDLEEEALQQEVSERRG